MKKTEHDTEKHKHLTDKSRTADAAEPLVPIEPSTVTSEQLEDLKTRAAKADEHWDRLLRTTADFDNFKKRAAREKQEAIKYANLALIEKLMPVLDHVEMALASAQSGPTDTAQSLQTGIAMILQQLKNTLTEAGLKEIDATGQPFDPNWHEAVSQQETTGTPEGHVVQQLRKGYQLHDRLLRPATVIVAKQPSPNAEHSK
jgi:molecular chaperone GrpE